MKKVGDCETFKGMTARFTACAAGQPDPEVEWFRGDTKLYPNDRVRMDRELNGLLRLSIAGVDVGDCGRYRLQITNPHGQASCEADLRFDGKFLWVLISSEPDDLPRRLGNSSS